MIYTYLDGAKGRKVPSVNLRSDSDFYIGGASHSDGVKQFHGAIDEFKIYDYAWEDVSIEKSIYESKAYVYEYKNADGEGMSLPYRVYYPTGYEKSAEKFARRVCYKIRKPYAVSGRSFDNKRKRAHAEKYHRPKRNICKYTFFLIFRFSHFSHSQ